MVYQGKSVSVRQLEAGIAELCFDAEGESVNKFDLRTVQELGEAISALEQLPGLQGVIATSGKGVFIVGADITEFGSVFNAGSDAVIAHLSKNNENNNRLEDLAVPVVVAINGFALGGGLEFCLACDYRVASSAAKVGLPETKLGLIPGWGGTVRLPRIAGVDTAAEWIASGQDQRAEAALKAGVVDAVVAPELLRDCALHTVRQCIDGALDFKSRRQQKTSPMALNDTESLMAFETAKSFIGTQAGKNYPAPVAAVKAMQAAAKAGREAALAEEAKAFAKLAQGPQAAALVGLFLSDQLIGKKAKGWEKRADKKIARAAVLGAGIMGGGIAYQSALKGTPIKMKDIAQAGIDLGLSEASKLLTKRVARGRMQPAAMAQVLTRIEPCLSYDGFKQVDMVVEAVVENPKVKHTVLAEVESHVSNDAIIASNTSTISISYLAEALKRPENFCGMHFFNPVHAMPLVEVIRGEKTSDTAVARTVAYANAMGKKAVVVKDCPGFLVNRVLFPYFAGFSMLLRDGADFQQVDRVMQAWGWPMGPAYLLDVVGIDTAAHCETVMAEGFPTRMGKHFKACTDIMYEAERYGQKNGQGFYRYETDKKGKPAKLVDEQAYSLLAPHCAERREFSDEDIIARMMVPMVTEMARCVEEGIVDSVAEADMALIYGLGFPPFRGGVFRWVDSVGIDAVLAMAEQHAALGELYAPTPGMLALSGKKYYA
ncbi:fatty acid oxidation complex subunit alpha FadB [Simiduia aestuariiviva]|uniref:enoyl-CoA hydratase n=1 Tax=Simiduia aestuariiviva TaxID=1510459 RepID=A0A839UKI0_9GAMM|nr:fatty acid oxidation complex subunit alpha FadB [Simiduia aestuariiviva]MBB3168624.1 3-hydroxyacyl-CoA dehydrogenase/enoyl-CoA hydratase/3-hydroxybutyryl-CoA epimerase/enoyl-CoA isomerase [Simiduia aestuariiviva]